MNKSVLVFILIIVALGLFLVKNQFKPEPGNLKKIMTPPLSTISEIAKIEPTTDFRNRVTKKPFGIFITPQNSPIQPERFTGFHTGADAEYEDTDREVLVFAVCNGEVVLNKWVNGYGGTLVLKCEKNYYLYGHLDLDGITKNKIIKRGDMIGILGRGNSRATDYERKHLHFGVNIKSADLRGYVKNKQELADWIDPMEIEIYE